MSYAQIIVDLSAGAVDRVFTYAVPGGMAVTPGQLVTVPFGPRTLDGFVVALTDACDLPPEKVRPILRLREVASSLSGRLADVYEALLVKYAGGKEKISMTDLARKWGVSVTQICKDREKVIQLIREKVGVNTSG